MKCFEMITSIIIVLIIFLLKWIVDSSQRNFEVLFSEAPIDIISLGLSYNIAFFILITQIDIYRTVENYKVWCITLLVGVVLLILIIITIKKLMALYLKKEKKRYFILCLVATYGPALPLLFWSISLLTALKEVV